VDRPLSKKAFFGLAGDFTPYVVADADGLLVVVPTSDRHHDKIFWKGIKEQKVLRRALGELERLGIRTAGTTFVDVGANIGTSTLTALRAGFANAVAFEPEDENFRLLRANLVLNDADRAVRAFRLALSDTAGAATIDPLPGKSGAARLLAADEQPRGETQPVEVRRLDDLVADGTLAPAEIGLLWLDVEGHEVHVLRGAEQALAHRFPAVLELNPNALRRTGGRADLAAVVGRHYTHVVDLRDDAASPVPSDEVEAIVEACEARRRATDVLCVAR
jgi:FkbM family methyltransferase